MPNINNYAPKSGRQIKEDGSVINLANKIDELHQTLVQMEYFGKSTDIKPTGVKKGSTFFEIDTKAVYMYDGAVWVVI